MRVSTGDTFRRARRRVSTLVRRCRREVSLWRQPRDHIDGGFSVEVRRRVREFRRTLDDGVVDAVQRPADLSRAELLIPCYNHARYLEPAFQSVLRQTDLAGITVTFVDDASTDDSLAIMRRLEEDGERRGVPVKVLHNEHNLLQGGSLNRAISESDVELLFVLNADDVLVPNCIELSRATYDRFPSIFMLSGSASAVAIDKRGVFAEHLGQLADAREIPARGHPQQHTVFGIDDLLGDEPPLRPRRYPPAGTRGAFTIYTPAYARNVWRTATFPLAMSGLSFFRAAWEVVGGFFPAERRVCASDDVDFQLRVCSAFPVGIYRRYPFFFYRTDSSQHRATS
jgi:glycosyltransferase involved in cell wall biosynthesis